MKTYLDQREIGPQPTLAAALETARRQAADLGRVVVEVKLDGVDLTDEQIDQPGTVAGERIECISADPRALVAMSFEQAAEALDEARAIQTHFGGDAALFHAFRQSCLPQFAKDLAEAEAAWAGRDAPALRRLAHSLKSVLATLGHGEAAGWARATEQAAAIGMLDAAQAPWQQLKLHLQALATAAEA